MRRLCLTLLLATITLSASAQSDPLTPLDFLLGTWSAKTNAPAGSAGAAATGTYTFRRDLAGHALARTSSADTCKGPEAFDCSHNDQLTIFAVPSGLSALYIDSEGHVIHYTITTPDPHTAIFLSEASTKAPQFRLIYHLEGNGPTAIMSGKFQMAAPGSTGFHSYLEWSGSRQ